jgi:hypothetical protein
MAAALQGKSGGVREAAALRFATALVEKRGRIDDAELKAVTDAGFTPGEVSEIVAHVVVNIFTNYFNNVARTQIVLLAWLLVALGLPFWLIVVPAIGLPLLLISAVVANTDIARSVRWRRQYELSIDRLVRTTSHSPSRKNFK